MTIKETVASYRDDMIRDLSRLVRFNSVSVAQPGPEPFGSEAAACLKDALALAAENGFMTVNMENYCGYAEMGEGKDIIGIVGHLDVVPADEGWETDPFTVVQKGNRLYGRGVSDDKGGVIAGLYAMKLLRDNGVALNKRIRLIMGCAEETGSACMDYYVAHAEPVTAGFTPDGDFPGIYGEKAGCSMRMESKNTRILSLTGGTVTNAVCRRAKTVIPADTVSKNALEKALAATKLDSFTVTEDGDTLVIDAIGVAAHASTPQLGVNAISCTMQSLAAAGMNDDLVSFYNDKIGLTTDGSKLGIAFADDYGALTLCNGTASTENGVITLTIDIRVPVTVSAEQVRSAAASNLEDARGRIVIENIGKALFFPKDGPLARNLRDAYIAVTGDAETEPMVIGGGTYAKHVPGIMAFGCAFPGTDNHIHDANESLDIDEFLLQVEIYYQAILNLLNA